MSPLSNSTSSSTSSDEGIQRRRGRKRKWRDYFERLMNDVVQKQVELQKKFLETLEKRERDRIAREEAWRVQEMARMNSVHDRLVQERSIASAKDAAVIAFLQKVSGGEHNLQVPMQVIQSAPENPQPAPPPPPSHPPIIVAATPTKAVEASIRDSFGGGDDVISPSSSRWPKMEVEALIKLRTGLDMKYQENGPKGPLWEEISKSMGRLGYNRNPKRCKEKWENINKYFKKVKESNKKRPEDSKTCPYFEQLDSIYKERAIKSHAGHGVKPDENPMVPIMAQPEQQWPLPAQQSAALHDNESGKEDQEEEEYEDDEEDEEVGEYEIIANKQPSSMTNTVE